MNYTVEFPKKGDHRGNLVALEATREIPFGIKRIYYIRDVPSQVRRGFHAHKRTRQMAFCLSGACKILFDDGHQKSVVELSRPTIGAFIEPMVWHEMFDFSPDSLLMVVADEFYEESDYIRDYGEFLRLIR